MNIYKNTIGDNIRKFRQKMNLTQEQLGNSVGVSSQAVSKWECGDNIPDTTLIVSIANVLDVSTDRLLGNEKTCENDVFTDIIKIIRDTPENDKYKKSFDITWMIETGLFDLDFMGSSSPLGQTSISEVVRNNGFTFASLYNELPFFMLFPEPENGFSSALKSEKRYRDFFEAFADEDVMNAFFYLYSMPKDFFFEKEVLAERCSISDDKIDRVIEMLCRYCIEGSDVTINDEKRTLYSCGWQHQSLVIVFAVLKTFLDYTRKNYILQASVRTKPYFSQTK